MKKKTVATIKDIAREAGVDPSTVSRALSGKRTFPADTMNAIYAAVEKLHYQPSVIAQALRSGKSHTIGVLVESIASPFHSQLLGAIERNLHGSGYYPVFASRGWTHDENTDALQSLLRRGLAGLILAGEQFGDQSGNELTKLASELPFVVVGGRVYPEIANQCLAVDGWGGAYAATRHLIDLGHRDIVHIMGILPGEDAVARRDGYIQALKDAQLSVNPDLIIPGNFVEQSGYDAVEALLRRDVRFSAIFAANDLMAFGAILALHQHGIAIPEQVSVVGFDDERYAAFSIPPLTTVRQPIAELGRFAVEALFDLMEGKAIALEKVPANLIIRASTGRP